MTWHTGGCSMGISLQAVRTTRSMGHEAVSLYDYVTAHKHYLKALTLAKLEVDERKKVLFVEV